MIIMVAFMLTNVSKDFCFPDLLKMVIEVMEIVRLLKRLNFSVKGN